MASIPCSIQLHLSSGCGKLTSPFKAVTRTLGWVKGTGLGRVGCKAGRGAAGATCLFNFGKSAEGAGIYGSQKRDEFTHYDVEQYFDYMGMLAVEGSYDKVEALLNQDIAPVDILLMFAASEGDKPKIEEVMRAGARYDVKDLDGRTALDRAESDEIRELILQLSMQKV